MKKVIFIPILLIGLGAVWTLYLEYTNKRFADSLPKGSATTQQPTNTAEAPAIGDKNNQEIPIDSASAEITAENASVWHEHAGPHPQSQADTQQAPIDALAEDNPAQNASDSNPVPPEVIEDNKRDLEWYRALKKWEEKDDALNAEWYELSREYDSISVDAKEFLRMGDKEKAAHIVELDAWEAKSKALAERREALKKEKPIRPTPTHTH